VEKVFMRLRPDAPGAESAIAEVDTLPLPLTGPEPGRRAISGG
jgi:hypothetical protein